MNKINLNNWKVAGFWPYTPILNRSMETGTNLRGVTPWLETVVPGSIYKTLQQNGLIDDPYVDMNSVKCEWVSNRWWVYKTTFKTDESFKDKRIQLIFKGIDYKAHIYLNTQKLSEHEGMYTPEILEITDIHAVNVSKCCCSVINRKVIKGKG
jgi:beta-mannosidase